ARGLGPLLQREREQQPLDRDKTVAGLLRDLLGVVEQPRGRGRQIKLRGSRALDFGQFRQGGLGLEQGLARASASLVDQPRREPLLVVEQRLQNMLRRELLMALAGRYALRRLNEAARPLGVFLDVHECFPTQRTALQWSGASCPWPLTAALCAIWAWVFDFKGGGTKRRGVHGNRSVSSDR